MLIFPKDTKAHRFGTYEEVYKRIIVELMKPNIESKNIKMMEDIKDKKATGEGGI